MAVDAGTYAPVVSTRARSPTTTTATTRSSISGGTPARVALLAATAVLLLLRLGAIGVSAPDEPVYAEMSEEVRSFEHGPVGLVLLHLNGKPDDQKPPLYYWAAALFGAPGGRVTETAARLPSALAGIACVWLVLQIGSLLLSRRTAVIGAALLVTTPFFAHMARRVALDVVLTMFELGGLYAFVRLERGVGRRSTNVALLHGALGLAVLDKGPVGFLLPLGAMVVYLAVERRLAGVQTIVPPWSLLLSVVSGLAWLAAATWLAPVGWFHRAVVENLWGRFFGGLYHPRPWHYFFVQFPTRCLPWSLFWPVVTWAAWCRVFVADADPERARSWRLLVAWVGVMFVFFSISAGKREIYMVPAIPAATLLTADALLVLLAEGSDVPRWWRAGVAVVATAAASAGVVLLIHPRVAGVELPRLLGAVLVAITAASAIGWWRVGSVRTPALARLGVMLAAIFALQLWMFQLLYPSLDSEQSAKGIARVAAARVPPGGSVGVVGKTALAAALRYYGGKPVELIESDRSMRSFLRRGGQVIVAQAGRLDDVRSVAPMRIIDREWSGNRALLVLTPLGDFARGHQSRPPAHAAQRPARVVCEMGKIPRAPIWQFVMLPVPPEIFDGVQLGGVRGQLREHDRVALGGNEVLDDATAVDAQPVPDHEQLAAEVAAEMGQEETRLRAADGAAKEAEIEPPPRHAGDRRKAGSAEVVLEHRRLAARRPSPAAMRALA